MGYGLTDPAQGNLILLNHIKWLLCNQTGHLLQKKEHKQSNYNTSNWLVTILIIPAMSHTGKGYLSNVVSNKMNMKYTNNGHEPQNNSCRRTNKTSRYTTPLRKNVKRESCKILGVTQDPPPPKHML